MCILWQEAQLRQNLLGLLNYVIDQDETFSRDLASCKPWSHSNGHTVSLSEIIDRLKSANVEVSANIFNYFTKTEFVEILLSKLIRRVMSGPRLCQQNYLKLE